MDTIYVLMAVPHARNGIHEPIAAFPDPESAGQLCARLVKTLKSYGDITSNFMIRDFYVIPVPFRDLAKDVNDQVRAFTLPRRAIAFAKEEGH